MTHIITLAQRKGGVGKSTLAVSIAAELRNRGRAVALTDADPQRSVCKWAEPGRLKFPVYDVNFVDQAITNWARDVFNVSGSYSHLIIDTAPSERAVGASIAVSSLVVVPCTPSGLDLEATIRTLEIIDMARAHRRGHPSMILVPNRVDMRTLEGRQIVEELTGFGEVVSSPIGDRSAFVRAFSVGKSVAELPDGQTADREIQMLCNLVERTLDA